MQQRQPRLGDILDDYCPRERRLTNHAVVAMIGDDIRLTRCTTCDAEHDYKQARVPRLRKKDEPPIVGALGLPVPKRIVIDTPVVEPHAPMPSSTQTAHEAQDRPTTPAPVQDAEMVASTAEDIVTEFDDPPPLRLEEGPVHRQLIRAQLPRHDGQPAVPRQAPDFTIRQPGGRANRFRPHQRSDGMFHGGGNRSFGNGGDRGDTNGNRGAGPRPSGRPPIASRAANRHGGGRKRSK